jgi:ABC-type molybdate transport system permease subunit
MLIFLLLVLQAALIIDMLRSLQLVYDDQQFRGRVEEVVFMGHSLGGACAIVAAAKVQVRHRVLLGLVLGVLLGLVLGFCKGAGETQGSARSGLGGFARSGLGVLLGLVLGFC